jgi:hypothetical protein
VFQYFWLPTGAEYRNLAIKTPTPKPQKNQIFCFQNYRKKLNNNNNNNNNLAARC